VSDPLRSLYCHTKNNIKRLNKAVIVSALFLFIFLLNTSTVSAETVYGDPLPPEATTPSTQTYNHLIKLFSPNAINSENGATLRIVTPTPITNFINTRLNNQVFNFKGKFNTNPNNGQNAEWFWKNVGESFIIRACNVDPSTRKPDERSCLYAPFPYSEVINSDGVLTLRQIGVTYDPNSNSQNPEIVNAAKKFITNELGSKIYRAIPDLNTVDVKFIGPEKVAFWTKNSYQIQFDIRAVISGWYTLDGDNLSSRNVIKVFNNQTPVQVDLWYCLNKEVPIDISSAQDQDSNVRQFGDLCDDGRSAYIRIAGMQLTPPQDATGIATPGTDNSQIQGSATEALSGNTLPHCAVIGEGTILGCLARAIYAVIFKPIAWFASLMGSLFDFFIGFSVSDETYRYDFVQKGWQVIRDFCNIFFIVLMVWTGLAAVFNFEKVNMKKAVVALIINAILINFSLFGTRLVIDLSNIGARIFYSRIVVCNGECKDENPKDGVVDNPTPNRVAGRYWPLSEKIVSAFNPQKILGPSVLNRDRPNANASDDDFNFSAQDAGNIGNAGLDPGSNAYAGYFIIICLIGSVIMFGVAAMFWKTAFIFVGRTIGLYVSMIFSPIAVLTRGNVPLISTFTDFSWKKWTAELSQYAVLAPMFVFYLYVIYYFFDSDLLKLNLGNGGSFIETVLYVCVPMLIVYFIISYGASITKDYSGKFGKLIQDGVDKTVGGAGGVIGGGVGIAAGAGAILGRQVIGRGLGKIGKMTTGRKLLIDGKEVSETWRSRLASKAATNQFARWGNRMFDWTQNTSWDARNAGLMTAVGKGVSVLSAKDIKVVDKISSKVGLAPEKRGIKKITADRIKEKEKNIENTINFDDMSDDDAKAAWAARVDKEAYSKAIPKADSAYAAKKDDAYKAIKKAVEDAEKAVKDEAKSISEKNRELNSPTTSEDRKTELKKEIKNLQGTYNEKYKNYLSAIKQEKVALEEFKTKNKDYEKDAEYRTILKEKHEDAKKSYENDYGKIKNGKQLTAVMRAEYAKSLREESFWMEDGKIRPIVTGGLMGGAAASTIAILGASLGAPFGAAMAGYIGGIAEEMDKATENVINKAKKNAKETVKSTVGLAESKILKLLNDYYDKEKHYELDKILDDKDKGEKYVEIAIEGAKIKLEDEIKTIDEKITKESDPTKRRELEIEKRLKRKEVGKVDKYFENYNKAKKEQKNKTEKGGEKPKEGGDDKSKKPEGGK
jgi:hypothetical protein